MVGMVAEVEASGWPTRVSGEWTVEMLDALPDDSLKYELLDGTLLVSPSPVPLHQAVIGELHLLFRAACPPDYFVFLSPLDWRPDGRTSLVDGGYALQVESTGAETVSLTTPLTVSLTADQLITI